MATMNISVTDKMRAWVEEKVDSGDFATASDCMRDLLRRGMEYEDKLTTLRAAIQKGIDSGPSEKSWEEFKDELRERAARFG